LKDSGDIFGQNFGVIDAFGPTIIKWGWLLEACNFESKQAQHKKEKGVDRGNLKRKGVDFKKTNI